jgi:hypothetical protein
MKQNTGWSRNGGGGGGGGDNCGKGSGGYWAAKLGSEWEFNSDYWAPKGWTQNMDLFTIVPKIVAHLNSTMSKQILQI